MSRALEINSNLREHVESCSSSNKNILSPLRQSLRAPHLAEMSFTMRGNHPCHPSHTTL